MDDVLIVGGGPAGMMAGLLFARAGLATRVLEKHEDFFRDFRGDTVHPSTMEILGQLDLLDEFLARRHERLTHVVMTIEGRAYEIADFSGLSTPAPFIAVMPQWDFLDFLRSAARGYRCFALEMGQEAVAIDSDGPRVGGVRMADGSARRARVTIFADGRGSLVRQDGKMPVKKVGAPMDVFWFRLPPAPDHESALQGEIASGRMMVAIDRGDYRQCALVMAKEDADAVVDPAAAVGSALEGAFPHYAGLADFSGAGAPSRLRVSLDRLTRWRRPGLLAIGDAAHTMTPVGGVGINLAVQDAVAAANALARPMALGLDPDQRLARVQFRREGPVRAIQFAQKLVQDRLIVPAIGGRLTRAPLPVRLLDRFALLRWIPSRIVGLGLRREQVRSPRV